MSEAKRCEACGASNVCSYWGPEGRHSDLRGAAMCRSCFLAPDDEVASLIRERRRSAQPAVASGAVSRHGFSVGDRIRHTDNKKAGTVSGFDGEYVMIDFDDQAYGRNWSAWPPYLEKLPSPAPAPGGEDAGTTCDDCGDFVLRSNCTKLRGDDLCPSCAKYYETPGGSADAATREGADERASARPIAGSAQPAVASRPMSAEGREIRVGDRVENPGEYSGTVTRVVSRLEVEILRDDGRQGCGRDHTWSAMAIASLRHLPSPAPAPGGGAYRDCDGEQLRVGDWARHRDHAFSDLPHQVIEIYAEPRQPGAKYEGPLMVLRKWFDGKSYDTNDHGVRFWRKVPAPDANTPGASPVTENSTKAEPVLGRERSVAEPPGLSFPEYPAEPAYAVAASKPLWTDGEYPQRPAACVVVSAIDPRARPEWPYVSKRGR